ncbi:flocculation protein FLO11-like [Silurus meridionalis]|uniref:flocculation protein FLO11-like n=1 Tax=Silurus meridionalis TaxID=175797 RepID=UPI001EEB82FA|nr:flocculation protein FLO11-like [Silurus meridionalis]
MTVTKDLSTTQPTTEFTIISEYTTERTTTAETTAVTTTNILTSTIQEYTIKEEITTESIITSEYTTESRTTAETTAETSAVSATSGPKSTTQEPTAEQIITVTSELSTTQSTTKSTITNEYTPDSTTTAETFAVTDTTSLTSTSQEPNTEQIINVTNELSTTQPTKEFIITSEYRTDRTITAETNAVSATSGPKSLSQEPTTDQTTTVTRGLSTTQPTSESTITIKYTSYSTATAETTVETTAESFALTAPTHLTSRSQEPTAEQISTVNRESSTAQPTKEFTTEYTTESTPTAPPAGTAVEITSVAAITSLTSTIQDQTAEQATTVINEQSATQPTKESTFTECTTESTTTAVNTTSCLTSKIQQPTSTEEISTVKIETSTAQTTSDLTITTKYNTEHETTTAESPVITSSTSLKGRTEEPTISGQTTTVTSELSTTQPKTNFTITSEYTAESTTTAETTSASTAKKTSSESTIFPTITKITEINLSTVTPMPKSRPQVTATTKETNTNILLASTTTTKNIFTIESGFTKPATAASATISGSAMVQSIMVFSSSSPVPPESLVLSTIQDLLSARLPNLTDPLTVLNFTYEKLSDTSYVVTFTLNINNISIPENPDLRNNTYNTVQSIVNNALNILLNEPGSQEFDPQISFFMSSGNKANGSMDYHFQDGDTKTPAAFLSRLMTQNVSTTTASTSPIGTAALSSASTPSVESGSAMVQSIMVFSSSSPVPPESLVLSTIQDLLSARLPNLTDPLTVLNFTYEKLSDTSYVVTFTLNINNISIPENPDLRNNTYNTVQSIVNNALNILLNEPGSQEFDPQISFFMSSGNKANGSMDYHFQDGDTKTPAAFLSRLMTQNVSTTTASTSPIGTAALSSASTPSVESGSAMVQSIMVFSSSSPVPPESLVLSTIQDLLSARLPNLTDPLTVLNFTYEKLSDTSYVVTFTLNINNISIPENPDLRNNTYNTVQSIVNNALNILLNEPGSQEFDPQISFFMSSGNKANGSMDYHFQDGDTKTPAAFLSRLMTQNVSTTTASTSPIGTAALSSASTPSVESGSAMVQSIMVFSSSSPVPPESLVLSTIQDLLSARLPNLTDPLTVLNFTYEKLSDTSYVVTFTLNINNISIPENPDLRNNTYNTVQSIVNNALNILLNEPGSQEFDPQISFFMSSGNKANGSMDYHFQDGDTKTPAAFLSRLMTQNVSTTTASTSPIGTAALSSASTPSVESGSAMVQSIMVFSSSSPVPPESLVLSTIQDLLSARLPNLTDPLTVLNFTYEKLSDTSYVVTFTLNINNISIPENPDLRNNTYNTVQSIVNNALNTFLNGPGAETFKPQSSFFMSLGIQVNGSMEYYFKDGDTKTPAAFLDEVKPILGNVLIYIRLVFKNLTKVPSEADVVKAANSLLDSKIRKARDLTTQKLNDPVSIQNITYEQINEKSYNITFGFQISNVTISRNMQLRNETCNLIQNTINQLLNTILNGRSATPFVFPKATYTFNRTEIVANSEYIFVEGVTQFTPSGFLFEILKISGLSISTTPAAQTDAPIYVVLRPTVQANTTTTGGSSAWILGIIIPCSIVIILIPCWILLCCLLCGCCAGLRRRYKRRRSYNTEYRTHNGLYF